MSDSATTERAVPVRAAVASFVGGALEFYDFFIYGSMAALVFNKLFFPNVDPVAGTLAAFATLGVAFLARPVGGIVFGHLGDHRGRKYALVATLLLMGVATFAIGLLPTYSTIGVWAPILLLVCRLAQGLASGGELGGASALAVEHAPAHRRGFFGAFAMSGTSAGTALGSGVIAVVVLLPEDQFQSWGWRIPFLLSALVVIGGFLVRRSLPEPPAFLEAVEEQKRKKALPLAEVLRNHRSSVLVTLAVFSAQVVAFYLVTVYAASYAAKVFPDARNWVLTSVTIIAFVNIFALVFWGAMSDRFGRRRVLAGGLVVQGCLIFTFFLGMGGGSFLVVLLAMFGVLSLGWAVIVGIAPAFFSELFPTEVRVTGMSLGMQLATVVGGFTPLVAAALVAGGASWSVLAIVSAALCAIALVAALTMKVRTTESAIATGHADPVQVATDGA